MEIVVTARHTEVSSRFRHVLDEKLIKVEQYAPKAQRLEVGVSHELNKRQSSGCERIELTLHGKGPVVRAEACAADVQSALDLAVTKLVERLRRAGDRRKVHHASRHPMASVRTTGGPEALDDTVPAPAAGAQRPEDAASPGGHDHPLGPDPSAGHDHALSGAAPEAAPDAATDAAAAPAAEYALGESPILIRDKVHVGRPMALDDALNEMELVGHDFFLFIDSSTSCPSVVYRRRGWSYGVIRLAGDDDEAAAVRRAVAAAAAAAAASAQVSAGQGTPGGGAGSPSPRQPAQVG